MKLAVHVFEEGNNFDWTHACFLDIEPTAIYRKYKEAAHILCSDNPISQANLKISPISLPLIEKIHVMQNVSSNFTEKKILLRFKVQHVNIVRQMMVM